MKNILNVSLLIARHFDKTDENWFRWLKVENMKTGSITNPDEYTKEIYNNAEIDFDPFIIVR